MLKLLSAADMNYNGSCYSLVIAIAKRARAIAEQAEADHVLLTRKPVQMAMEELASGRAIIVETQDPSLLQ